MTRYKVGEVSNRYLLGLRALKKKGVDYCISQLHLGVQHFEKITLGDYSDMKELFFNFPLDHDENSDGNVRIAANDDECFWNGNSDDSEEDNDFDEVNSRFGFDDDIDDRYLECDP